MEKVDSLFERYLRHWDQGRPQGAHNMPRRGQLRDKVAKRKFKEVVLVPSKQEEDKGNCRGVDESSSQEITLKHFEITS